MAELQSTDDTRGVEDVANMLAPDANCPTTVLEESELPGGFTKLNQPVVGRGAPVAPAKTNPNLRGKLGR
jgi:hypothetical protein